MSAPAHWQDANDRFLGAALSWLRVRLQQLADEASSAASKRDSRAVSRSEAEMEAAAAPIATAEGDDAPPALLILSNRLGLSRFERETLLLCAAMELDTRIAGLCARAQDDLSRPYPTFALALALFEGSAWEVLSPERPLRYWRLVEIDQAGSRALTTSGLRADERIVNYLKGLNYLDDRLSPFLLSLDPEGRKDALPASQEAAVETILRQFGALTGSGPAPVIQLVGSDSASKDLVAGHAAADLGLHPYRLSAELLPEDAAELETLARLWQREGVLLPVALYVDAHEMDQRVASNGKPPALDRFLARSGGVIFLSTRDIRRGLARASQPVDVAKPTPTEQRAAWSAALGSAPDNISAQLAGQFNLGLPTIREIARASFDHTSEREPLSDRLWDACLADTRPQLDTLAQRLDAKATWDDIVVPAAEMSLLRQIADQVRQRSRVYDDWGFRQKMNRGLGITALFAGESGTGKTMAAEVIANELRLNLYRIDLSAVVDKYIGETEKNLRRLFDAAEDGGAILFFDEADALFGKRSEVKDSHDRYANIEINYLLQRMEGYLGLAILATNMKSALDQAFMRRLRFIVNFPFPGAAERRAIWEKVFPSDTPLNGFDHAQLARLNLTGGSVHNVALSAAFLAARARTPVTMPLVLAAARDEFRKLDRPVNEADFHWREPMAAVT